jgi:hemoglobin
MSQETPVETQQTAYALVGGEAAIRALVHRFYDLMDTLPEAYGIRKLHPADLSTSEQKLFMYLSGWLGGPDLYVQQNGHPRLRARHLPFPIGSSERDQWLLCMRQALDETILHAPAREGIYEALVGLADHMRNRADG